MFRSVVEGDVVITSMATKVEQARFFDERPPLYPWPEQLRRSGLRKAYKPREAMWVRALEGLALRPGDSVLDLGCGSGIWLDRLRQEYGIVGTGLDVSMNSLREARRSAQSAIGVLRGDAAQVPLASGSFDVVMTLDALEHVADQRACLREMVRVLKPGGRLFLWTINRNQKYTWNWWLSKIGIDIWDRVAHDPLRMPGVAEVVGNLEAEGMIVGRPFLFNSFFTLAVDEAIMLAVSVFERLGLNRTNGRLRAAMGGAFLSLTDILSRGLLGVLSWLDAPWIRRGYSNGFLVLARRDNLRAPDPGRMTGAEAGSTGNVLADRQPGTGERELAVTA